MSLSDKEFMELWDKHKSPSGVASETGTHIRNVHARRRRIEARYKIELPVSGNRVNQYYPHISERTHPARHPIELENGQVFIFSDAHFWPQVRTTAFRAFLHLARKMQPAVIVNNGDAIDGASISRHPRIGWDSKPSMVQEIKCCQDRLGEIKEAAPQAALFWTLGNHDARFENFLAAHAPQFEKIHGFTLKDHFPDWIPAWAVWVNDEVVIKHRYKGGVHATHNNTVGSGKTMVTGHLHSLKVTPYSDYNGSRFGVDTGTLADADGPQFEDYLETNPTNWRSGFVVLTFRNGKLLWPEVVHVIGFDQVEFRGEIIDVSKD